MEVIEAKKWKKLCLLDFGNFGSLHLAAPDENNNSSPRSQLAVKSAEIDLRSSLSCYKYFPSPYHTEIFDDQPLHASLVNETRLLLKLRGCEYVVQGYGVDVSFENGKKTYNLILEYAPGGNLENIIKDYNGFMSESLVATYTDMLLEGLFSIHSKEIVHCDFKPKNILVFPTRDKGGIEFDVLKIANFGMSRETCESNLDKNRCSLPYASPEALRYGRNEKSGDIWALGCVVVEMITGTQLWEWNGISPRNLVRQIKHGSPRIPENISQDAQDFLRKCLAEDPSKRWTAPMLLTHPFIIKNTMITSRSSRSREYMLSQRQWFRSIDMFSTSYQGPMRWILWSNPPDKLN